MQDRGGTGFDKGQFVVDWEAQTVTCPAGKTSLSSLPGTDHTTDEVIHVRCSRADRSPCPQRTFCAPREVKPREVLRSERAALPAARQRQTTEEVRAEDTARAGIEGIHQPPPADIHRSALARRQPLTDASAASY